MKKQNKYTKICQELNAMAKANAKSFTKPYLGKMPGVEKVLTFLEDFVDKLTAPEKVAAFFESEGIEGGEILLMFTPFLFNQADGVRLIKEYGERKKKH